MISNIIIIYANKNGDPSKYPFINVGTYGESLPEKSEIVWNLVKEIKIKVQKANGKIAKIEKKNKEKK